jgi:hypothetical protein
MKLAAEETLEMHSTIHLRIFFVSAYHHSENHMAVKLGPSSLRKNVF